MELAGYSCAVAFSKVTTFRLTCVAPCVTLRLTLDASHVASLAASRCFPVASTSLWRCLVCCVVSRWRLVPCGGSRHDGGAGVLEESQSPVLTLNLGFRETKTDTPELEFLSAVRPRAITIGMRVCVSVHQFSSFPHSVCCGQQVRSQPNIMWAVVRQHQPHGPARFQSASLLVLWPHRIRLRRAAPLLPFT